MVASRLDLYRWLTLARAFDRALCTLKSTWFPNEGEEAAIVGSFVDLRPDDAAAVHYRDPFIVYHMRGAELWRLAAQALGKAAGYNKGRSVPFTGPAELGIVPWVAGDLGTSIGVATGAALAFQQEDSDRVCVCSFGDGAANRGDFHESLILAACWKLPIVYICQNNGWAISQRAADYLPAPVVERAAGYGMPGMAVDGSDVEAVRAAVGEVTARARQGCGPALLEVRARRGRGHWAGDTMGYRRPDDELPVVDPIALLGERLLENGEASADDLRRLAAEAQERTDEAVARAQAAPDAGARELGRDEVYA